jgi:hypothetical protein
MSACCRPLIERFRKRGGKEPNVAPFVPVATPVATPYLEVDVQPSPAVAAVQIASHSAGYTEGLRIQQEAMDKLFYRGYSVKGVENGLILFERRT